MILSDMCKLTSNTIDFCKKDSKSPIESLLMAAIVILGINSKIRKNEELSFSFSSAKTEEELERHSSEKLWDVVVGQQIKIGPHTPDFCAIMTCNMRYCLRLFRLVIECDGHEWHEKTKEQAAADRKRDRLFVKNGYAVMRFTGSEIWRDPMECVIDIDNFFYSNQYLALQERELVKTKMQVRD